MLARRIDPPDRGAASPRKPTPEQRAAGRRRKPGRAPTRGPRGEVRWWERPAPRGDLPLWEAVQRLQARRLARGVSVQALAADLARIGHRVRRETLSRVLNGKQRTSWETADAMAEVLGVDLDDLHAQRSDDEDEDEEDATVVLLDR
jgi:DNA-binding XRE family transcriptional regulator